MRGNSIAYRNFLRDDAENVSGFQNDSTMIYGFITPESLTTFLLGKDTAILFQKVAQLKKWTVSQN